ncbi:CDP-glycerol glycerophosphotransferase family protein [Planococcus shenhongbingii]|uniref:CDP-glycerol glycerophosphotransferase family protein n=1 Tax=Planococcus shenhongbingii TaxID=3058398 RepID=UPI00261FAEE9|nr:CDP-glycerol glycerophosphotransferase family protein [Planococcus sp. N016]WKA59210.1 CDP-glycerol glycerophosphotransferase family protein [Planococcus sp. N016]
MKLKEEERGKRILSPFKIALAFAAAKLLKNRSGKPIVLVGGNLGEKYEDNASVLHQYLNKQYADTMEVYWLYDPKTNYAEEQGIRNALALGSFRNYFLFFQADYSFHGHSIRYDLAPSAHKFLFLNTKTVMTHVSHGIEGFKKILIQKEDVPLLKRTDFFNCASQFEMRIKRDEWKIPQEKLIVTGFPRFDRYTANQPAPHVKKVLAMMTWREWLMESDSREFEKSDYFVHTSELLKHAGIQELLESQNMQVTVALHPFMQRFESHFNEITSERVHFIGFDQLSISQAIEENDMLLTDITSVSWDFLYLNKPIIFYLFDQEDWEKKRGIYMDLNKDLYGYKAKTVEEVYEFLKEIAVEGVNFNKWYSMAPQFIDFFDQNNCKRLTERVFGKKNQ